MENKRKENPGSSKSNLIIITPGECMKLGLFQDIQSKGIDPEKSQTMETSVASLKQKLKDKFEAYAQKPVILNSQIPSKTKSFTSTTISKVVTSVDIKISDKQKDIENLSKKDSLLCDVKKHSKITSTDLDVQNSDSNRKEKPTVLNSAISKCCTDIDKLEVTVTQKKGEVKREVLNLKNTQVLEPKIIKSVGTIDTISVKGNSESKPENVNASLNTTELVNVQLKSKASIIAELTHSQNESSISTVKEQQCNFSEIETTEEILKKKAFTPEVAENVQSRDNWSEITNSRKLEEKPQVISSEVVRREVNIISNTPVCFSNEELKSLVTKVKNISPNSVKTSSIKNNEQETSPSIKTISDKITSSENTSFAAEEDAKLDLPQTCKKDCVVTKSIINGEDQTLEEKKFKGTDSKGSPNELELEARNKEKCSNQRSGMENDMQFRKMDTKKETATSSESRFDILKESENELHDIKNKKSLSNNVVLGSTSEKLCDLKMKNEGQSRNTQEPKKGKIVICKDLRDMTFNLTKLPRRNKICMKRSAIYSDTGLSNSEKYKSSSSKHTKIHPSKINYLKDNGRYVYKEKFIIKGYENVGKNLKMLYNTKENEEKIKTLVEDEKHTDMKVEKKDIKETKVSSHVKIKKKIKSIKSASSKLKTARDFGRNKQKWKESNQPANRLDLYKEKLLNKDHKMKNKITGVRKKPIHDKQHMKRTETDNKNYKCHYKHHKKLSEQIKEKPFDVGEGEEAKIVHNIQMKMAQALHKPVPGNGETILSKSEMMIRASCSSKENKKHVEVDKVKAVGSHSKDLCKVEIGDELIANRTDMLHNSPPIKCKGDKTMDVIVNTNTHQEKCLPEESSVTPKNTKMILQTNRLIAKDGSEEERSTSNSEIVSCATETDVTDDKFNPLHSQHKNSSEIGGVEHVGQSKMESNDQSSRTEEGRAIHTENVEKEENHLFTQLMFVPKKRGRKRKIVEEECSSKVSNDMLQKTDDEKNCLPFTTDNLMERKEVATLVDSHLGNPRDVSNTTEILEEWSPPFSSQKRTKNVCSDVAVAESGASKVTSGEKLVKKRGRPRKNTNLTEIQELAVPLQLNEEEMITSTPLATKKDPKSESDTFETSSETGGVEHAEHRMIEFNKQSSSAEEGKTIHTENVENEECHNHTQLTSAPKKRGRNDVEVPGGGASYVNIGEKLPKKRGRPRKNKNLTEIQESAVSSPLNEEKMITSTPLAKKRGPQDTFDAAGIVQMTAEALTPDGSMSKRKRKRINYFELQNSTMVEDDFDKKRRRCKILANNTYVSEANTKNIRTNNRDEVLEFPKTEDNSSSKTCLTDTRDESDITRGSTFRGEEETSTDSNLDNKQEADGTKQEDSEVTTSGTDKLKKKTKYRRTGETAWMMKSIFSAAVKNATRSDSAAQENSLEDISTECGSSSVQPKRDPEERSEATENIVIDEHNTIVTCMSCGKKVEKKGWHIHNRKIHYNLGWREGEQAVDLNDPSVITQTLTPILQKIKKLKCHKCSEMATSVGEYMAHIKQCDGVVTSGDSVTCAVCKQEMKKTKWSFHKQKQHNNLAWRTGDPPLDLNNQSLVTSILNALYKAKKPLCCEKCGSKKKSVVGFLSHQAQCGTSTEDAKVKCEFCDKRVLPVSMPTHIKFVHETPKKKEIEGIPNYFDMDTNACLSKRKAAKTAMLIIDKFSKQKTVQERTEHYITQLDFNEEGFVRVILKKELAENHMIKCKFKSCEFETAEVKILLDHMSLCEKKPDQYYTCKKCLMTCEDENNIIPHLRTVHNVEITEDDFKADDDEEESEDEIDEVELYNKELKRRMLLEKKKVEKDINYRVKPACTFKFVKKPKQLFSHALYFTSEFCSQHFSKPLLFNHLRYSKRDWILLDDDLVEKYLPKSGQSCEVARTIFNGSENVLKNEYTLKKYELFEADCDEGVATIFCGGPVYAMAWLPTPYSSTDSNQILAVAAASDFEEKYLVNVNYSISSLVQFWDFGILENKKKISNPKLMFCLAFDFGPVWHMEWCPSGCFDDKEAVQNEEMGRMGLLAVAGSNSVVYIYSIPSLEEEQMGLIYKAKPLLELRLTFNVGDSLGNEKFYATRISWSMALDHRYVAVGYSNGMVGIFDLNTSSKLVKCKNNDVEILLPYKSFRAHTHYVSALNLVHLSGGNRWLFTASFDRNTYVWDLSNDSKVPSVKKNIITDGAWLTNWVAYVTTADESSTNYGLAHASVKAYRDYMYEHVYITGSPTTIMSLSLSNWLNSIIQSSSVGEIIAVFPNQLLYSLDSERSVRHARYLLGCTKLLDKHKTPAERVAEEDEKQQALFPDWKKKESSDLSSNSEDAVYNKHEPITYKEAEEKYGLLFCDRKADKFADFLRKGAPKDLILKPEELELCKPNLYSLQAINKIAYNPNRQASLYYATGYQAGFVRLRYIKFLENDPQIT